MPYKKQKAIRSNKKICHLRPNDRFGFNILLPAYPISWPDDTVNTSYRTFSALILIPLRTVFEQSLTCPNSAIVQKKRPPIGRCVYALRPMGNSISAEMDNATGRNGLEKSTFCGDRATRF